MLRELLRKLKREDAGRKSIEPVSVVLPRLSKKPQLIDPRYPRETLYQIEKAVFTNPVLSQVHNLTITLANTGHTIEAPEEVKTEIDQLAQRLNVDAICNALFSQLVLYGCVSLEVVVASGLSGVEKLVRVHPATVYFAYDKEEDTFKPYQVVGSEEIELNPNTYLYIPLLTIDGSPYAIPPMLASLSLLDATESFIQELKSLSQKMGLLGFLDVSFPQLPRSPSETEVEYQKRARDFLQATAQDIAQNISKGILLHFEGTEVEFKEVRSDSGGIKEVLSLLEKWLIEGAKGQPALLGFSEGLTETWATVSLHVFISQLRNYQQVVERVLEYVYKLHAMLKGLSFEDINVSFAEPPDFRARELEEVRKLRAESVVMLLQAGLLSPEEAKQLISEVF